MCGIAQMVVGGGKSPTSRAVAFEFQGIFLAMLVIDEGVRHILIEIVGVAVFESAWVESQKAVMREEERSAVIEAEWQGDIEVGFAIFEVVAGGPSFVIDFGIDGEAGVGGSQNVGDEAFVPALNFVVHAPAVVGTPMPVKGVLVLGIPVPFAIAPEPGDPISEFGFLGRCLIEVGAYAEQSLEEVG